MNRSLLDTGGGLLLVPQFTLAADTRKGLRPSFTSAAAARSTDSALFDRAVAHARARARRATSPRARFGAHMRVSAHQ